MNSFDTPYAVMIDYKTPFHLDTPEKVEWANRTARECEFQTFDYRLHDHSWFGKPEWRDAAR